MHAEGMRKDEAEDLIAQAEEALVRVRKAKDAAEEGRLALFHEVEGLKARLEELAARNEELEAENDRSKQHIAELTKQRARLTKLCGLRPARNASVSPSLTSGFARASTPTVAKSPSSLPKTPVSGSRLRRTPISSKSCKLRSSQSAEASATAVDASPAMSGSEAGKVCDTSYSPVITQDVIAGFDEDAHSPSRSTPLIDGAPLSMRQGSMTVFSVSGSAFKGRSTVCSPPNLHETKMSLTGPISPAFGRHSAERGQRHKERRSSASEGNGTTPWKQERRLTELAKKNQIMRSNIARAEKRSSQIGNRNAGRKSLDESRRRFSREKFILEHAGTVPAFVADALRKQLANKGGIDQPRNDDKENVCLSPPPAAVEISMEATKANVSVSGSAVKKSARIRRSTISAGCGREI